MVRSKNTSTSKSSWISAGKNPMSIALAPTDLNKKRPSCHWLMRLPTNLRHRPGCQVFRHRRLCPFCSSFKPLRPYPTRQLVQRTLDASEASPRHTRVDFRCLQVCVSEQLLNIAHVDAILKQVGGEGVSQCVRCGVVSQANLFRCFLHHFLGAPSGKMSARTLAREEPGSGFV